MVLLFPCAPGVSRSGQTANALRLERAEETAGREEKAVFGLWDASHAMCEPRWDQHRFSGRTTTNAANSRDRALYVLRQIRASGPRSVPWRTTSCHLHRDGVGRDRSSAPDRSMGDG